MLKNDSPKIVRGGKTVYGAGVGILMLETRFPRIPGDIGNAGTWPFPVFYKVVGGASPDLVVRRNAEGLLDAFIAGGRELVAQGADGITTNCGFLSLFQAELSAALRVPVATSALMQAPLINATLPPGKQVGVLTVSRQSLSPTHLKLAGVPADTPIIGTDEGEEFTRVFLDDLPEMDLDLAERDMLAAGRALVGGHPDVGAILLECTNMVPFAADLRAAFGLPVYSIYSFVQWFQAGLLPRRFAHALDDPRPIT